MLLYMVKDHSDNERGNPNFIGYSSKDIYMYHLTESVVYTMTFVTPDVEHWLEWEVVQWVQHEGLCTTDTQILSNLYI